MKTHIRTREKRTKSVRIPVRNLKATSIARVLRCIGHHRDDQLNVEHIDVRIIVVFFSLNNGWDPVIAYSQIPKNSRTSIDLIRPEKVSLEARRTKEWLLTIFVSSYSISLSPRKKNRFYVTDKFQAYLSFVLDLFFPLFSFLLTLTYAHKHM